MKLKGSRCVAAPIKNAHVDTCNTHEGLRDTYEDTCGHINT